MTYGIGVWEGTQPANADEASREFEEFYIGLDRPAPASAPIRAYLEALRARYPADAWETEEASGGFAYFELVFSHTGAMLPFVAEAAAANGLICFDPQRQCLL